MEDTKEHLVLTRASGRDAPEPTEPSEASTEEGDKTESESEATSETEDCEYNDDIIRNPETAKLIETLQDSLDKAKAQLGTARERLKKAHTTHGRKIAAKDDTICLKDKALKRVKVKLEVAKDGHAQTVRGLKQEHQLAISRVTAELRATKSIL